MTILGIQQPKLCKHTSKPYNTTDLNFQKRNKSDKDLNKKVFFVVDRTYTVNVCVGHLKVQS